MGNFRASFALRQKKGWSGVAAILLVFLSLAFLPSLAWAAEPSIPDVSGQNAIAVDTSTGLITYAKNVHRRAPMASTTKMMTALTALGTPGTNLTDRYTVVADDIVGTGETAMGLRLGENVSFSDLLYGMLINSGNDAAKAVARYAGAKLPGTNDPIARFIERMNAQAQTYGLRNTHYVNPHGLDADNHYSSAFDLAITGWYALQNPTIAQIVSQQKANIAGHSLVNLNSFLKVYSGANGIKTGYDLKAGLCLVASATRNGRSVIVVSMNTDQVGFTGDAVALMDYSFELLKLPDSVLKTRPPAGGGPFQATTQYIGYPKGNVLLPAPNAQAGDSGASIASNPNSYLNGPGVAAQINTSPVPTLSSSGDDQTDSSKSKPGGGPNLIVILFILVLIGLVIFGLGRAGYLAGETGRNAALRAEDMAVVAFKAGRKGVGRLVTLLKPGNQPDDEEIAPRPSPASRVARSRESERVEPNPAPRPRPTTNPAQPAPRSTTRQNPLENFFDDVQPFNWDEKGNDKAEPLKPPAPIPTMPAPNPPMNRAQVQPEKEPERERPVTPPAISNDSAARLTSYSNRSISEQKPKPGLSTPEDRLRPPQPTRPASTPRPETPPATPPLAPKPAASEPSAAEKREAERNFFSAKAFGPENLAVRARQAVDYAYAGRLQASTEEFRRVVEVDPLFDFGGLEEFEQMPVLGYKALASAYASVNRMKFALLLLDMSIEKFPNDLELRNMLRTLKREGSQ